MFPTVKLVLHYKNASILYRNLYTSHMRLLKQDWRMKQGLTENPNSFGPLTNLPDYSFRDGRPVPLGIQQMKRIIKQKSYAARIIKLVGEMDHAVAKHSRLQQEKEEKKQKILSSKLKPKGDLLLNEKSST